MTLQLALADGGAIRTPEMGGQMLVNNVGLYFMTGTCNPAYVFDHFDQTRTDWEVVSLGTTVILDAIPAILEPTADPVTTKAENP